MQWNNKVSVLRALSRVVGPTAANGVPLTHAPNEREEKGEDLGSNPPPLVSTCALDTSPTDNGNETRWPPPALAFASC